ncbi:SDR family oxidoreductase [Aureimonas leprariae]|uniref:SDR family oxidoreductase n=1 Tax=Plantimonas leprariae TaxID=2615207 RepID=A0A7V7PRD5_9HYPH|nr:SDR family oxidoreductase [Aureimonas leprariae]KAB0681290.1 SDR family oxidoreductase [Aureimonas leprariae]
MYAVTAATGQLGRLVVAELLESGVPAGRIVAAVRDPAKAADLAAKGVEVREADYDRPETLRTAFEGVRRVLLISSSAVGVRVPQHQAAIDAAKAAGVELLAYTSILHADTTPAQLAEEHKATEAAIGGSGLPAAILRNGWYTENHLMALKPVLEHGAMVGAAGEGRFSSATRADYAAAAAKVLTADDQAGKVYELAGDDGYTYAEFAAELSRRAGKEIAYRDLSEADYKEVLVSAGLPEGFAAILADADEAARGGALHDSSRTLSRLIGRPTTPMPQTVEAAVKAAG